MNSLALQLFKQERDEIYQSVVHPEKSRFRIIHVVIPVIPITLRVGIFYLVRRISALEINFRVWTPMK